MLLVHGVRLPLTAGADEAVAAAARREGIAQGDIMQAQLHKVSVDARRKTPVLVYSVAFALASPEKEACFTKRALAAPQQIQVVSTRPCSPRPGAAPLPGPVVVCGLGPAGLFAALQLAQAGYAPLVLERGPNMERRRQAVAHFESTGLLDTEANIQFGEGGAGTFSDGKLTSRIKDPLCAQVISQLLQAGAPEEIAWRSKPHIGTDKLREVFTALRGQLLQLGGQVLFDTRLDSLVIKNGRLAGVVAGGQPLACGALVLACGHSARDTFKALDAAGVPLQPKAFSVGMRIEHLQADIDRGLYHGAAGHPALPPGEYQLSARFGQRGVYTFCMCPGGSVVAAASEAGGVVTNGMSLHARGGPNANAAVVAGVGPQDFEPGPFGGIALQQRLEQAAHSAGGGGYTAPAETLASFMQGAGRLDTGRVQPSYPRGVRAANLGALLPPDITGALRAGLAAFGRKLPGYGSADAVLTGLETRTSSPVRVPRGENGESTDVAGLYPCGEGAGYAGGIMSAAVDGIKTATAIIQRYAPPR